MRTRPRVAGSRLGSTSVEAVWGAKDKRAGLIALADRLGFPLAEVCYVGDADRDAPALEIAGLGLAPNGATPKARAAADHVLSATGGRGAVAEAVALIQGDRRPCGAVMSALEDHANELREALGHLGELEAPLRASAASIAESVLAGGKLLAAGNGGSAAEAQHLTSEFVGRLHPARERRALPAVALHADTSTLTAVANDYGYEEVFARQVQAIGTSGDVLVVLSTSGVSPNLVRAVDVAREEGLTTVGLLGRTAASSPRTV